MVSSIAGSTVVLLYCPRLGLVSDTTGYLILRDQLAGFSADPRMYVSQRGTTDESICLLVSLVRDEHSDGRLVRKQNSNAALELQNGMIGSDGAKAHSNLYFYFYGVGRFPTLADRAMARATSGKPVIIQAHSHGKAPNTPV
jgi:hypothetical protein